MMSNPRGGPGRKPKPTILRLIEGNPGHRPIPEGEPVPIGEAEPPDELTDGAKKVWRERIAKAHWLTWADADKAMLYCELTALLRVERANMSAAKMSQFRNIGSELGFDPSARARMGTTLKSGKQTTGAKAPEVVHSGEKKYV